MPERGHGKARSLAFGAAIVVALSVLFWKIEAGKQTQQSVHSRQRNSSTALAQAKTQRPPTEPEELSLKVLARRHHDSGAFTQGLVLHHGRLFESTGLEGSSTVREIDPQTGEVIRRASLAPDLFGEGLALVGDRLIQLTWREGRALVWDRDSLEPLREFRYEGEGWGLCYDGTRLVMSDGSSTLTFRDPVTFETIGSVPVTEHERPLRWLNELECVRGNVFANVWQTDRIVRIDPRTGWVTAAIDARGLLSPEERLAADVLNGIAWIEGTDRFLITGKLWPRLFEVKFVPAPN